MISPPVYSSGLTTVEIQDSFSYWLFCVSTAHTCNTDLLICVQPQSLQTKPSLLPDASMQVKLSRPAPWQTRGIPKETQHSSGSSSQCRWMLTAVRLYMPLHLL